MASIVVSGDTSGTVTISAPAVAGTTTLTLPSTSGTVLTTASSTGISGSAISSGTVAEAYGGTGTNTGYYGFKNRILNGQMVIDQRNAGASVATTTTATPTYSIDRWAYQCSVASKFTVQQNAGSVTLPAGFKNYLGATVGASANVTVGTGDYFLLRQPIEGFNTADLGFGAAGASTVTLSFWVRSSLTGTFGGSLENGASDRSYPFTYTISSANTWEQKSVTIAGDTSGTWVGATNSSSMLVVFSLGMGSTYSGTAGAWVAGNFLSATGAVKLIETNSATFYLTGVQLEKGSTATSFDYRPYGTELSLCQRYFQRTTFDTGDYPLGFAYAYSNNTCASSLALAVPMRAQPTAAIVVNMGIRGGGFSTSQTLSSLGAISFSNGIGSGLYVLCNPTTSGSSLTSYTTYLLSNIASGGFTLSAEL